MSKLYELKLQIDEHPYDTFRKLLSPAYGDSASKKCVKSFEIWLIYGTMEDCRISLQSIRSKKNQKVLEL